ncbi:SDR family NAD(P)-dependent oxidoreductase [Cyclobacterium xiamenense]|uniref:SDR family NAD(P)-dependent oxidoreductase n=1 Tax=Cyclobacterium xiamenense TaxID=1297121 RepID=UPI0035D09216
MKINNPYSLKGKTILITGASSGIGQSIAILCASQGAKLLLIGRDRDRLEKTKDLCENKSMHEFLSVDLLSFEENKVRVYSFLTDHAPIYGLVHAAGISPTIPFKILKEKQLLEAFNLNVFSVIYLIQAISKVSIRSSEGMSIVLISSVMSEVGEKGKSLYSMTKSSLVALSKSLALEYANKGIRLNAISPSVVDTPLSMNSHYRKDENSLNDVLKQHPLGLGMPSDIANAAVFLLSDASRWVTGTNLIVDGGYLAR